jgi:hypothetical protein
MAVCKKSFDTLITVGKSGKKKPTTIKKNGRGKTRCRLHYQTQKKGGVWEKDLPVIEEFT